MHGSPTITHRMCHSLRQAILAQSRSIYYHCSRLLEAATRVLGGCRMCHTIFMKGGLSFHRLPIRASTVCPLGAQSMLLVVFQYYVALLEFIVQTLGILFSKIFPLDPECEFAIVCALALQDRFHNVVFVAQLAFNHVVCTCAQCQTAEVGRISASFISLRRYTRMRWGFSLLTRSSTFTCVRHAGSILLVGGVNGRAYEPGGGAS